MVMEDTLFIGEFRIETFFCSGFPIAMFDYQRVLIVDIHLPISDDLGDRVLLLAPPLFLRLFTKKKLLGDNSPTNPK